MQLNSALPGTSAAPRPRRGGARPGLLLALALSALAVMAGTHAETGAVVPDWSLDTADGVTIEYHRDTAGSPSILLFWATWCPYCRALMPHIEAVRRDYADRGVPVFALNIWEDDDPAAYLERHGYGMTLLGAADLVAEDYGIQGTPGLLLVDGNHRLVYARRRGDEPAAVEAALRDALDSLLAGSASTTTVPP